LITRKWHEKEALRSSHLKTPSHQPLDWSPRDRAIHTTTRVHTLYWYIKHTTCSDFITLVKLSTTRPRQQLGSASFDKDNYSSVQFVVLSTKNWGIKVVVVTQASYLSPFGRLTVGWLSYSPAEIYKKVGWDLQGSPLHRSTQAPL
jgi:hypothetical protein